MTGGLNRIGRVVGIVLKRHIHEITLDGAALGRPQLRVEVAELVAPVHLVLVEGEAGNVRPREFADVAHGTTDAAADVEDLEFGCGAGEGEFGGEVVFVSADGFGECFVGVSVGEVEGLSPAPFVEECC